MNPAAWVPVAERLPETRGVVLIVEWDGEISLGHHNDGRWFREPDCEGTMVTHWMPLPALPAK